MIVVWSMYTCFQIDSHEVYYLGVPGVAMPKLFEVMHKLALHLQRERMSNLLCVLRVSG